MEKAQRRGALEGQLARHRGRRLVPIATASAANSISVEREKSGNPLNVGNIGSCFEVAGARSQRHQGALQATVVTC